MDGTADVVLDPRLEALVRLACTRGERAWLVGGTVRDRLLGRQRLSDVDLAVEGDVVSLAHAFAEAAGLTYVPLSEERGTVRLVDADGTTFDLTALGARGIEADLARRDFTVNAMALDPARLAEGPEAVLDPFGGLEDLRRGIVRATSERVLAEDPLRMLRAFRFAAELGFTIDPETLEWTRRLAPLASRPAAERVSRELFLTLARPGCVPLVRVMDETGVLPAVLPETSAMRGVTQNEYHHLDVWGHSLEAVAMLEGVLAELPALLGPHAGRVEALLAEEVACDRPRAALLKFVTLLHDIGKPATREERDGKTTFYTHTRVGAGMTEELCGRLRLSHRETVEAVRYVDRHLVPSDLLRTAPLTEKRWARFFRRNGEQGICLFLVALADGRATRGPAGDPAQTERMAAFLRTVADQYYGWAERRMRAPSLLGGRDLLAELRMRPGPDVGHVLEAVRRRQVAGEVVTREQALDAAREVLARLRAAEERRS